MHIIRTILANTIGAWLAHEFIGGFTISGGVIDFILVGLILSAVFLIIRPIFKLLSFPLILLTTGLFTLVINGFLIWLVSHFTSYIAIIGFMPLVWATLIITLLNMLVRGSKM